MVYLKMALHGGLHIANQEKCHVFVRRRLVFDEHINITTPGRGFKTVEHVAELLTEIIFDERSGFQLLCAEIADGAQTCWQVELHKITGYIRLCQKLSERRIVWRGRRVFFIIRLGSDPEKRTCIGCIAGYLSFFVLYHSRRCSGFRWLFLPRLIFMKFSVLVFFRVITQKF